MKALRTVVTAQCGQLLLLFTLTPASASATPFKCTHGVALTEFTFAQKNSTAPGVYSTLETQAMLPVVVKSADLGLNLTLSSGEGDGASCRFW